MYEETFIKYVVVVVLFAAFLLLANVWHYQNRGRLELQSQRRRRRRSAAGRARVAEGTEEPDEGRPSFWSRALPWLSIVALVVCIAALAVMWYAMGLAAVQGGGRG